MKKAGLAILCLIVIGCSAKQAQNIQPNPVLEKPISFKEDWLGQDIRTFHGFEICVEPIAPYNILGELKCVFNKRVPPAGKWPDRVYYNFFKSQLMSVQWMWERPFANKDIFPMLNEAYGPPHMKQESVFGGEYIWVRGDALIDYFQGADGKISLVMCSINLSRQSIEKFAKNKPPSGGWKYYISLVCNGAPPQELLE